MRKFLVLILALTFVLALAPLVEANGIPSINSVRSVRVSREFNSFQGGAYLPGVGLAGGCGAQQLGAAYAPGLGYGAGLAPVGVAQAPVVVVNRSIFGGGFFGGLFGVGRVGGIGRIGGVGHVGAIPRLHR